MAQLYCLQNININNNTKRPKLTLANANKLRNPLPKITPNSWKPLDNSNGKRRRLVVLICHIDLNDINDDDDDDDKQTMDLVKCESPLIENQTHMNENVRGDHNQPEQNLNPPGFSLIQSIKSILINMCPSNNQPMNNNDTNNNETNAKQSHETNLDWPESFIQLLQSLTLKQLSNNGNQNNRLDDQLIPISPAQITRTISPVSSLAMIDDRDFELIAWPSTDLNAPVANCDCDTISLWLMNFAPADTLPTPTVALNPIDSGTSNVRRLLEQKSASTTQLNTIVQTIANKIVSANNDAPPRRRQRRSTLPLRFNQIITLNLNDADNINHSGRPSTSILNNTDDDMTLNESFVHVQDFDDDDTVSNSNNVNNNNNINNNDDDDDESERAGQAKMVPSDSQQRDMQSGADSTSSQLASGSLSPQAGQQAHLSSPGSSSQGADEESKHSLLQFALHNFREAIDKYSLESRAGKTGGDTSTLRGSLKLIETLRRGRSSSSSSSVSKTTASRLSSSSQATKQLMSGTGDQDWTWREVAEMVKFTRLPLRNSLLKMPSEDLNKRAVDCFMAIMQYMGDAPESNKQQQVNGEVECVYLILMNCHNYPILRDEIYCQLMKQTTNNRSSQPDICLRGWRLFSILAAYFDCSKTFRPYLVKYLETAAYDKRRAYCSVAALCLQNLRKTFKFGGRKNVPSIEEIAATSAGRNSKRQIYRLPGGTERVINTKSTTVVEDIIQEICHEMLNVNDQDEMLEFSLYCIADGDLYTMPLNRDEYILDITTELIKNHQHYFLIFCRSIWHYPLRLDSRLYIEVIFNQIAPDYLEGLLLVLPGGLDSGLTVGGGRHNSNQKHLRPLRLKAKLVKDIARIAALLHRASGIEYMPQKDEIRCLIPKPIVAAMKRSPALLNKNPTLDEAGNAAGGSSSSASSAASSASSTGRDNIDNSCTNSDLVLTTPAKWVELVQTNWQDMSAFDTLDAKAQFLDIVRHWPLFGSSFFAIKFIQRDLIQPMDFILALNKFGIHMLDLSSHETIHSYSFNEVISTRKVRSEDGALFLDLKCGNLMKRTIIRIQTDQAHEISRLIRQYIDIELLQQQRQQQQTTHIDNS